MIRNNCPICNSPSHQRVAEIPFASGGVQVVVVCRDCGMGFAQVSPDADYRDHSRYAEPDSTGSGHPLDLKRLEGFVDNFERACDKGVRILDIGCGQGALLTVLKDRGYTEVYGLEPSPAAMRIASEKGHTVFTGSLPTYEPGIKFDVITLNHVLEHIANPLEALRACRKMLDKDGGIFIEVPYASSYAAYMSCPLLDFNREHINHFSERPLALALMLSGFVDHGIRYRTFSIEGGSYPAMYVLADRCVDQGPAMETALCEYWRKSTNALHHIVKTVAEQVPDGLSVCVWGAGEFSEVFIPELSKHVTIAQIVDRSPSKWGSALCGIVVEDPCNINPNTHAMPIVLGSMMNQQSILESIKSRNLPNKIIAPKLERP